MGKMKKYLETTIYGFSTVAVIWLLACVLLSVGA